MGRVELGRVYWAEGSGPIDLGLDRVGSDPAQGPRIVQGHNGHFTGLLVFEIYKNFVVAKDRTRDLEHTSAHTNHQAIWPVPCKTWFPNCFMS